MFPHWEIVRYLSNVVPWPYPPDGAYTYYRDSALPAMERGDAWHWTLRLKVEPDRLIGSIGLMKGENTNRGFWLGLPWQGKGFMTEACEAATDFWFNTLKFPVLRVPKAVANVASRRISEKSGMRIVAREERDLQLGDAALRLGMTKESVFNATANLLVMRKRVYHFSVHCTPALGSLTMGTGASLGQPDRVQHFGCPDQDKSLKRSTYRAASA